MTTISDSALGPYAIASALIALQLVALALWTGTVRVLRKQWVNPEDAKVNKGENTELDHADVRRVQRAHHNLLENSVPFFVVGALYVATGASHQGALIYCGTFVVVRFLHTIFYLIGLQPFRTIMFAVGVLTIIGMAVHVLQAAI